jgi:hypothetical protein
MLNESEREHHIPGTYYLQKKLRKKSIHRIAQEKGYSRDAVERAITGTLRSASRLSCSHPSPVSGPYHTRIAVLLEQNKHLLPRQRYTTRKIFEILFESGQMVSFPHLLVCA